MRVLAASVLMFAAGSAFAADQTREVKFERGRHSATVNSSIKGYDTNTYILGANAGQAMSVLFDPSNSSCYFNIRAPGADEAAFDGSMSGSNEFSTNLEESGNYTAQIYMMRNAARRNETCRFSITFEISG